MKVVANSNHVTNFFYYDFLSKRSKDFRIILNKNDSLVVKHLTSVVTLVKKKKKKLSERPDDQCDLINKPRKL